MDPVALRRPFALVALLALAACRIETRPPAGVARTTTTVQAAVAAGPDALPGTVTRADRPG